MKELGILVADGIHCENEFQGEAWEQARAVSWVLRSS